jgi:hypothetical protein
VRSLDFSESSPVIVSRCLPAPIQIFGQAPLFRQQLHQHIGFFGQKNFLVIRRLSRALRRLSANAQHQQETT